MKNSDAYTLITNKQYCELVTPEFIGSRMRG